MAISPTSIPAILQGAAGLGRAVTPALRINNSSSSSSAANVAVNPVISVVNNGSAGDLSAAGSASGSPNASTDGSAPFDAFGPLSTPLYTQTGGSAATDDQGGGIFGIDPLFLIAGGALLFVLLSKKGKGAK